MTKTLLILFLSFLTFSCQTQPATTSPKTLKVVSYNIRHAEGMDGKINTKRITDLLTKTEADLISLQEVDKGCTRSEKRDIVKEIATQLNMFYAFGKFMDHDGGEYGMAVLSRFPITKTIRHQLPKGTEPRCALEIRVQTDAFKSPLSFIGIHNEWKINKVRSLQIKTLITSLKDYKHPIILSGDFNGQPTDPSLKLLIDDKWHILDKKGAKTWPSQNPRVEIDFIMTKQLPSFSVEHYVIEDTETSDHRPIYAKFSFK